MTNKNLNVEIVSPISNYFGKFLLYMPNPDLLLKNTEETLDIYESMLLDGRIFSLIELRKTFVLDYPFHIQPAGESGYDAKVAAYVRDEIENINWYQELKELLSALEYGYSLSEIIWKLSGGNWAIERLNNRKQQRFIFKPDGTVILKDGPFKELTEPYKFVIHRHNGQAENPYGASVLKQCYWPYMFKKAGFRFWMTASEKFGVPTVMALFDTDDEDKARKRSRTIAEALSNIQNDAAVALANVKDVKALETKGGLAGFKTLIDTCNNEISYSLTGQTLATAESKFGTRAQSTTHERILNRIVKGDADELSWTLNNTIIKWLVELNFGANVSPPKLVFETDEYASWDTVKDAIDRGVPVSLNALYKKYSIPKPDGAADQFVKAPAPTSTNLSDPLKKKSRKSLFYLSPMN